jgi:uncharacterized membrane protein YsdA (DUF1294 family)
MGLLDNEKPAPQRIGNAAPAIRRFAESFGLRRDSGTRGHIRHRHEPRRRTEDESGLLSVGGNGHTVLLIAVAIQGRVLELSRKLSFRTRYRTVLLAVVVFGGETGTLMTLARHKTNGAAHLYVYLALVSLGVTMLYLALVGPDRQDRDQA